MDFELQSDIFLPLNQKKEYLQRLIGKMTKTMHLIEEEVETGFSPQLFIYGQLLEIKAMAEYFDNELIEVFAKLKTVYDNYKEIPFTETRKLLLEIRRKINFILDNLKTP